MIVLIGGVAAVLLLGALVLGAATLTDERAKPSGLPWIALAGGAVVVVLLLVAAVGVVGVGGRSGGGGADDDAEPEPAARAAVSGAPAAYDAVVRIVGDGGELRVPAEVGGVGEGDVVELRASGFAGDADGVVAQCDGAAARRCTNVVPVRTDSDGSFRAGYRVAPGDGRGVLVVDVDDHRAAVVLGDGVTDPVRVEMQGRVAAVSRAGSVDTVRVAWCDADGMRLEDCRSTGDVLVGDDGTASVRTRARPGDWVVLVDDAGTIVASTVAAATGSAAVREVETDPGRLAVGLVLAVMFVAIAVVLIRRTDWRPPVEAEVEVGLG